MRSWMRRGKRKRKRDKIMNIKTGIGRGRRKNNVEIYCTSNA